MSDLSSQKNSHITYGEASMIARQVFRCHECEQYVVFLSNLPVVASNYSSIPKLDTPCSEAINKLDFLQPPFSYDSNSFQSTYSSDLSNLIPPVVSSSNSPNPVPFLSTDLIEVPFPEDTNMPMTYPLFDAYDTSNYKATVDTHQKDEVAILRLETEQLKDVIQKLQQSYANDKNPITGIRSITQYDENMFCTDTLQSEVLSMSAQLEKATTTPLRSKQNGRHCGEIHLRLDAGAQSIQSRRPLLFADGPIPDIENNVSNTEQYSILEPVSQNLQWAGDNLNVTLSNIYANLLGPFTDVVCLFLSDFGGLASIVDFVALWLNCFTNRSLPSVCYPRLLIAIENSTSTRSDKCWESRWKTKFSRLLRKKTTRPIKEAFSYVGIHHLVTNDQIREEYRYLPLKDRLLNESDAVRAFRIEQRMHFVGKHFNAFFDYAYNHFIHNIGKPFNFIKASRLLNPVFSNLKQHFFTFVKQFQTVEEMNEFALPVVASCILLDSFPPGMHGFDPVKVFQTLYQTSWRKATKKLTWATRTAILPIEKNTEGAQFGFKPKTKGVNVLGIDGGGVRGVIPLQSLLLLEQKLKPYLPDMPLQDLFDIAFGTSSGGLSIMAMFLNGLPVTNCLKVFENLSHKAFDRGFVPSNSIFSRLRELLISYFADSLYSAHNLEEALRTQFGDEMSLMDHSAATSTGAKVGITVTGVPNAELVFTNYNGVGSRPSGSGYRHVLSDDSFNRVRVWEAARCTSAAPWYFRPHHIDGVGTFQDGGLWRNNPIDIAISEARALWPTIVEPDVVLSLGTGYQVDEDATMGGTS
ncbi:hypothetical protein V491_09370, partial [Pseudogymnoascus sp. VKM F-3775]